MEIARRVPCHPSQVTQTLHADGVMRNVEPHRYPEQMRKLAVQMRSQASRLMEKGHPALKEAALCMVDAACEIERAYELLEANERVLHD
jgi:hypothetical protein